MPIFSNLQIKPFKFAKMTTGIAKAEIKKNELFLKISNYQQKLLEVALKSKTRKVRNYGHQ